ncbi:PREDICTED: uncharacterized protein LOC104823972 [Tarenaya hassleriana]|uniref:uncharacterized protein LOC104823972 n=1 Tax=Tarenaya hassleriana TaxID=28532 RepID=UPI00053C6C0D|nr:PREDICTED: uncharacterized protein LOC104823972 [Tarenaya hassleriana]
MEPPPPPLSSAAAATVTTTAPPFSAPTPAVVHPHVTSSYPDSVDSSPRSRTTDGWDDLPGPAGIGGGGTSGVSSKLRLMCSYGGHIIPRPHDKSLCYIGGDTRIVVVDRNISLSAFATRLSSTLLNGRPFTLKYQLPSEELDSLISVTTDEDLDNMTEEYDRTISCLNSATGKPSRLRLFLFSSKPEATQSMGQILESSVKSDDWFLNALNSAGLLNRGFSDSDTNVNRLLGLDDGLGLRSLGGENGGNLNLGARDVDGSVKSAKQEQQQQQLQQPSSQPQGGQDVHSVPDSPMLDTTSSFGSTSSSPSLANLPPIRVHVEEAGGGRAAMQDQKLGTEDQFAQFNVGGGANKQFQRQQEDAFATISSPPPPMPATLAVPVVPLSAPAFSAEFHTRVISDDEKSDQGVPAGYKKPPTPHSQPHNLPPQAHLQKSNVGGHELPSPDSVSSDSSLNNALSRQKPTIYHDVVAQMPSSTTIVSGNLLDPKINPSNPNAQTQIQDSGYVLHTQFEQQSAQSQQQFIHAATPQYIHHHNHPSGGVPVPTYIQVYPQQQQHRHATQLDHQPYPVYYVTAPLQARQSTYNMLVPQSGNRNETLDSVPSNHPQASPNPSMPNVAAAYNNPMRTVPGSKPEMGSGGVYTAASGLSGAQFVQLPTSQQFVGYPQIHHPPQSVPHTGYGYEFADPSHAQIYLTQPLAHAPYQTVTGSPATMVLPDGSTAKLPAESVKQQMRSSQPV